ncbi:MAG: ATP-binding cassette domain-containing protein [Proteobacteria bacterium]|nr:ATP-binding cassette domain-containing protein [Pseudomonadota bacterium]
MSDVVLSTVNLEFGHDTPLCEPLNWQVHSGEIWAIAGTNGCGKTTLLRTILGFLPPQGGHITMTSSISYIAQTTEMRAVPMRVEDIIYMGAETRLSGLIPFYRRRFIKKVDALIHTFELDHLRKRSFHEISPGERQRTLLAQSIVRSPELICLDEATSAMDPQHTHDSFEYLVKQAKEQNCAIIAISHSLYAQLDQVTHLLVFSEGKCFSGKREDMMKQHKALFTAGKVD